METAATRELTATIEAEPNPVRKLYLAVRARPELGQAIDDLGIADAYLEALPDDLANALALVTRAEANLRVLLQIHVTDGVILQ